MYGQMSAAVAGKRTIHSNSQNNMNSQNNNNNNNNIHTLGSKNKNNMQHTQNNTTTLTASSMLLVSPSIPSLHIREIPFLPVQFL
ncbi:putative uncharacterized protein DDB_G0283431 [Drosophila navojoa]|uniref:putative uncharacterized protein DDB_G0283431 n=1 Tax=Drosophila navojoa TaxID=7232 RepID=UPI000846EC7F|nr:putative uncharacterized protein DDB_G0283431 [Drosophila navojoa]